MRGAAKRKEAANIVLGLPGLDGTARGLVLLAAVLVMFIAC